MKTTIVSEQKPLERDPWEGVTFPCLVESSLVGYIALAINAKDGIFLYAESHTGRPAQESKTWQAAGYVPVQRPVTITFEN